MKSFQKFISEISVNSSFPPLGLQKIPRQGKPMVPQEDDPKKDIIPIAIHHKFFQTVSDLRRNLSMSNVHGPAVRVLLKAEDQMKNAQESMVLVMASNEEVHDLKQLAEELMGGLSPDSQMYKVAFYLRQTSENGIKAATTRPGQIGFEEWLLKEKNWIQDAVKKPGALSRAAKRNKKSKSEYCEDPPSSKAKKRCSLWRTLRRLK